MKNTPAETGKTLKVFETILLRAMPRSGFVSEQTKRLSRIIAFTAALVLTATMAKAQHIWEDSRAWAGGIFTYDQQTVPLFSAHELSLDLSGSYLGQRRGGSFKNGAWGGDVGLNYFITRHIGVGADVNMSDNGGLLVDSVLGSLIFRLPLGDSGFAPYVLGGGGRTSDPDWEWAAHAGLGIEFRPNHRLGIFSDARYVWREHSSDALLVRAGIRLVF